MQLKPIYTELPDIFYAKSSPKAIKHPELVLYNDKLAQAIGLETQNIDSHSKANIFCGNHIITGSIPLALAYSGHQYGYYTKLGDGRAHMLGSLQLSDKTYLDLQLKGSGPTPYSRTGDGLASLESMLREYIVSEAMYALGIQTTRSLAVVKTGSRIQEYTEQTAGVLTRIARSHIRVGSFEYAYSLQDKDKIQALIDYTIKYNYPELNEAQNKAQALLKAVITNQEDLLVQWMRVGFIHGVMNTDNMSIIGETIDYGPCAFMDNYHPDTVFSFIDKYGRYAYQNQPVIAQWNLARFAYTLLDFIDNDKQKAEQIANTMLAGFKVNYIKKYQKMMCDKLGLLECNQKNYALVTDLLSLMQDKKKDYTNTFKDLAYDQEFEDDEALEKWYLRWQAAIAKTKKASFKTMQENNPVIIPRNHQVQKALSACSNGDYSIIQELINALSSPYSLRDETGEYELAPKQEERVQYTYCGT